MALEYRIPAEDELPTVLRNVYSVFGEELKDEDLERDRRLMPLDRVLAAWDGETPVGVTASWPFELTVPGGAARAAGVTWVAVLASHRRRGVLTELMRRQLEDVRVRGEPLAILWASEAPIYGRFGYGVAAPQTSMRAERSSFHLRDERSPRGSVRLVTQEQAAGLFPPLYEKHRLERPGLVSRSEAWWRDALLADPEHWRDGAGPKSYAVLELDGEPQGYAFYRVKPKWEEGAPRGELRVSEVFAATPDATAELWRFLFGIDLIERVDYQRLDPPWSLFLMATDPRRLHLSVGEGLWLRVVDLEAAFAARTLADGEPVVLEVEDRLVESNAGRWQVGPGCRRTEAEPDVALDVADLASVYLGAFSFDQLAAARRVRELRGGGIARATALFATPSPPSCPEGF